MPTTGLFRGWPPVDPKNPASPKVNTPPSEATNQYPWPSGVAAMPTTGLFRGWPACEPWKTAFP